jgi:hypothetical protein
MGKEIRMGGKVNSLGGKRNKDGGKDIRIWWEKIPDTHRLKQLYQVKLVGMV